MMEVKLFEIRDSATCLPVIAIKLISRDERETAIMKYSGYDPDDDWFGCGTILMAGLAGGNDALSCSPHDWDNRTRSVAHTHILTKWDELKTGDLIDVQYLLNETAQPKQSDIPR